MFGASSSRLRPSSPSRRSPLRLRLRCGRPVSARFVIAGVRAGGCRGSGPDENLSTGNQWTFASGRQSSHLRERQRPWRQMMDMRTYARELKSTGAGRKLTLKRRMTGKTGGASLKRTRRCGYARRRLGISTACIAVGNINRLNATTCPCKTDGTCDPPRKRFAAPTANKCPVVTPLWRSWAMITTA
jgi:hypothetical protein